MPAASLIMHAAAWSQALPPAALLASRRSTPGRRFAALAAGVSLVGDAVNFGLATRGHTNLWVGYISTPGSGALALAALATWHGHPARERLLRYGIPVYLAVWLVAILLGDDLGRFSVLAFPAHSIFLLGVCLWTMLRNALVDTPFPIPRSDWLWIAGGFALLAGSTSTADPLMNRLVGQGRIDDAMLVINARAGVQLLASLLITAGMLCPVPTAPSGASFSPPR